MREVDLESHRDGSEQPQKWQHTTEALRRESEARKMRLWGKKKRKRGGRACWVLLSPRAFTSGEFRGGTSIENLSVSRVPFRVLVTDGLH